jgi:negative regulator of sigma E activity
MKRWTIGWIAAAVALAAILIVVVDIVRTQSGRSVESAAPVTRTSEAARSAGASVTPSDPKQAR